ncbi:hypothetical protein K438DRAFT_1986755 [Mycena galopus ATCC 62051]|nr:hypothetical protein K438DRAFT_1986755 [Mycena galopus ATCC 62051]
MVAESYSKTKSVYWSETLTLSKPAEEQEGFMVSAETPPPSKKDPAAPVRVHLKKGKKKGTVAVSASAVSATPATPVPAPAPAPVLESLPLPVPAPAPVNILLVDTALPVPAAKGKKGGKEKKKAAAGAAAVAAESMDDSWTHVGDSSASGPSASVTEDSLAEDDAKKAEDADEEDSEAEEIPLPSMRPKVSLNKPPKRPLTERLLSKLRKPGVDVREEKPVCIGQLAVCLPPDWHFVLLHLRVSPNPTQLRCVRLRVQLAAFYVHL